MERGGYNIERTKGRGERVLMHCRNDKFFDRSCPWRSMASPHADIRWATVQGPSRFPRIKSIVPGPGEFFLSIRLHRACFQTLITTIAIHGGSWKRRRSYGDRARSRRGSFKHADLNMKLERDLDRINSRSTHPFAVFLLLLVHCFANCYAFINNCFCWRGMTRYNEVLYNVMKYKRYGSMETKRSEEYILEYLFHDIVVYGFQFSNL